MELKKRGVYIHIPFCARKCNYCDFNSSVPKGNDIDRYLDFLEKEISLYRQDSEESETESIFIGGGTPSILSASQLEKLFGIIDRNIRYTEDTEYTMECNPGTLSSEKLEVIKKGGVNRLSIGLQAIKKEHLEFMGRIHSLEDFENSFENARKAGFDNINVDLMFAFQGQSFEDWKETLQYIVKVNPEHISAYSLIIEEGTDFYRRFREGEIDEYSEDGFVRMYDYTAGFLKEHGYEQYEISNYSKEGKQCRHNIIYWECREYYGWGLGSSGYIHPYRYTNRSEMSEYEEMLKKNKKPILFKEKISSIDSFNEMIFLGLRMNKGIDLKYMEKKFDKKIFKKLEKTIKDQIKKGNIEENNNKIHLTKEGRKIANTVFIELMQEK